MFNAQLRHMPGTFKTILFRSKGFVLSHQDSSIPHAKLRNRGGCGFNFVLERRISSRRIHKRGIRGIQRGREGINRGLCPRLKNQEARNSDPDSAGRIRIIGPIYYSRSPHHCTFTGNLGENLLEVLLKKPSGSRLFEKRSGQLGRSTNLDRRKRSSRILTSFLRSETLRILSFSPGLTAVGLLPGDSRKCCGAVDIGRQSALLRYVRVCYHWGLLLSYTQPLLFLLTYYSLPYLRRVACQPLFNDSRTFRWLRYLFRISVIRSIYNHRITAHPISKS